MRVESIDTHRDWSRHELVAALRAIFIALGQIMTGINMVTGLDMTSLRMVRGLYAHIGYSDKPTCGDLVLHVRM